MKEDQQQVFCHSNVCKEEADLLFFEEKGAIDSSDPSNTEFVNRKDQFFFSGISSAAAEFSQSDPDNSVIKHELHELTVSYEESNYNVVKDICVDEGGKISIESWTGDPARFHATLPSDQDKNRAIQEDDDSKCISEDQSKPRDVDGGGADECTIKKKDDNEPLVPDCLKISSEVDDSKGTAKDAFVESTYVQNSQKSALLSISDGNSCAEMSAQMPSEEANAVSHPTAVTTTAEKSAENISKSAINSEALHKVESSDKTSASPAVQDQCSSDVKCSENARGELPLLEDKPDAEDKTSNYLSVASCRDQFTDGETSFSAAALVAYSGSISLRSDSSTTSTRSFAFPVLQSEWNGSPVRMAKAQKKRCWRSSILCCRF